MADIIFDLNLPVSESTLKRALVYDLGMGHRIERKTPWLSKAQKAARLKFAREHISWDLEEWRGVLFTDEMSMQTGPNQGRIYVWRYPEEEYLEDCCGATVVPGFAKVKVWGGMRYGELSELVVMPEKEGGGKLNAQEYFDVIMDGELLDFWMKSMEDVGYVLVMEDGAPYQKGAATKRRKEYENMGWIGWGPGTWPSNSSEAGHMVYVNARGQWGMHAEDRKIICSKCSIIPIVIDAFCPQRGGEEWRQHLLDKSSAFRNSNSNHSFSQTL